MELDYENPVPPNEGAMPHLQTEGRTSPIGHLSRDVLTLILNLLHDSSNDDPSDFQASRSRAQVYVTASHVSRFWRFVALENPLWWSKIIIRPQWKIEAVEAYLKRSKQCRLELKFSGYDESSRYHTHIIGPLPTDYQQLLNLILPHLHRCRALHLAALFHKENALPFSSFQPLLVADMPHLEDFILQDNFSHYAQELFERGFRPIFKSAPVLRTLGLSGVDLRTLHQPSPLLTVLHLCQGSENTFQIPFKDLKVVLESCQLLTTLAIYNNILNLPLNHDTAEVPALEDLFVLGDIPCLSDLLLFLQAPKLKSLVIMPVTLFDLHAFATADPAVRNAHFPSLKSLTLSPVDRDDLTGVKLASVSFPFVERLVLINTDIYECVDFLAIKGERKIAFSNLKELGLMDLAGNSIKAIRDMARNRAEQNRPLHTVYLDSDSYCNVLDVMDEDDDDERLPFSLVRCDLWEPQRRRLLFS